MLTLRRSHSVLAEMNATRTPNPRRSNVRSGSHACGKPPIWIGVASNSNSCLLKILVRAREWLPASILQHPLSKPLAYSRRDANVSIVKLSSAAHMSQKQALDESVTRPATLISRGGKYEPALSRFLASILYPLQPRRQRHAQCRT